LKQATCGDARSSNQAIKQSNNQTIKLGEFLNDYGLRCSLFLDYFPELLWH